MAPSSSRFIIRFPPNAGGARDSGEYVLGEGDVIANQGRRTLELTVTNTGDRPIQIGSHFHFEVNRALRFDRAQAFGMRLNVRPAGPRRARRREARDAGRARRRASGLGLNALTEAAAATRALAKLAAWERPS